MPLGTLDFCEAIHGSLLESNMEGPTDKVADRLQYICHLQPSTVLSLNVSKCEATCNNLNMVVDYPTFRHFHTVSKLEMSLLGAPVLPGPAVEKALQEKKTEQLKLVVERLSHIPSRDAFGLLKAVSRCQNFCVYCKHLHAKAIHLWTISTTFSDPVYAKS